MITWLLLLVDRNKCYAQKEKIPLGCKRVECRTRPAESEGGYKPTCPPSSYVNAGLV